MAAGLDPPRLLGQGFVAIGVEVMQHTLEKPRRLETLEDNLPVVATWILVAGQSLYSSIGLEMDLMAESGFAPDNNQRPNRADPDRWDSWRNSLRVYGNDNQLSAEARSWCLQAIRRMDEIQGTS